MKDTGEHIRSFERKEAKPTQRYDELFNMITELQRKYAELRDRLEWMSNQGKVGTVWVIEKEKKKEDE